MKKINTILLLTLLPLAACEFNPGHVYQGYVEAEYTMVSATSGGLLQSLDVRRGQDVAAGQALFAIDQTNVKAIRDSAAAELVRARAERDDLLTGDRPEEIEVIRNQKDQAAATLVQTRSEYQRVQALMKSGVVTKSKFDNDKAAFNAAAARVKELDARLASVTLGGRTKRVEAANAAIVIAEQNLVKAEKQLMESIPKATAAAKVDDTFYRPGEYIPPGRPVVSLLVPGNLKIRFFIPQDTLPKVKIGQHVTITCDGCVQPYDAKISFIANEAEYTPPVIYSNDSRKKLVFMIEALPQEGQEMLHAGLPIDATLEVQ